MDYWFEIAVAAWGHAGVEYGSIETLVTWGEEWPNNAVFRFDLSHHHVYLSREMGTWRVSGIIDWAEAALGPPEWDIACLWHWTFKRVWHAAFTEGGLSDMVVR